MYDKTTIMQIAIIVIGIVITLYLGIKEKRKNEENINKLNLRINVNGIRGKSTATRLITGVLNEAGYKVVGKTTGTSPRMIYWNNKKEEVINASDGYVRNFLFPKNLAVEANAENMAKLQAQNSSKQFKKDTEKEEAQKLSEKMNKISLRIQVKAGENGKIFGGVSAKDISEAFEKQHNIKIDKKKVDLKETIKTLGVHIVSIKLFEGVVGKIKVDVIG